jgi:hypothetical protein
MESETEPLTNKKQLIFSLKSIMYLETGKNRGSIIKKTLEFQLQTRQEGIFLLQQQV